MLENDASSRCLMFTGWWRDVDMILTRWWQRDDRILTGCDKIMTECWRDVDWMMSEWCGMLTGWWQNDDGMVTKGWRDDDRKTTGWWHDIDEMMTECWGFALTNGLEGGKSFSWSQWQDFLWVFVTGAAIFVDCMGFCRYVWHGRLSILAVRICLHQDSTDFYSCRFCLFLSMALASIFVGGSSFHWYWWEKSSTWCVHTRDAHH